MKAGERRFRIGERFGMVILIAPITPERWLVEVYEDLPEIRGMDVEDIEEEYPLTEKQAEEAGRFIRERME
jgi:hypothetical protein